MPSAYRKVISENCRVDPSAELTRVRRKADRCHKGRFTVWEPVSLHFLWGAIHLVFALLGLSLAAHVWWPTWVRFFCVGGLFPCS